MASVPSSMGRRKAMADVQDIDVEQVMEQVRENIRRRRQEPTLAYPTERSSDDQVTAALASLHHDHDIYRMHFTSHRRVLGPFVLAVKKTLRQLLTPILVRQASYNDANTRVIAYLMERLAALEARLGGLEEQQRQTLERRFGGLEERQRSPSASPHAMRAFL